MSELGRAESAQFAARSRARSRARRWARARPLIVTILGACALAAVGWVVFGSSLLAVHRVVVVGASSTTQAQVTAAADSAMGTSMFTVDTGAVGRRVAAVPAVASVAVSRQWPRTLQVHVKLRRAVVAVRTSAGWQLVDGTGVAFATVPHRPATAIRLVAASPSHTDPATMSALAVLRSLPAGIRHDLVEVTARSADGVQLRLRRKVTVIWGTAVDSTRKAATLAALLRTQGGASSRASGSRTVYDVSTPGLVTTR